MSEDILIVLRWWVVWAGLGSIGWLMIRKLFTKWDDQGYLVSKIWGVGVVSLISFWLGSLKVAPNTNTTIIAIAVVLGLGAAAINGLKNIPWKKILIEELLFLALLTGWAWVKGHEPAINGLEKFMDYGFAKSLMRATYFPPADMWYSGESINYYYFGHLVLAQTTALSGVGLEYTFNLMLATLFALAFTMAYSIGKQLTKQTTAALFIALILSLGGNLQTIYAFTQGYTGDDPPPFWTIWSDITNKESFTQGWNSYWYPNATRFIPFTIHEFPSYSFVVSDIHGHVLGIPFALLCIGMLINMFVIEKRGSLWNYGVYGLTTGMSFMTNALDGPIYLGLLGILTVWINMKGKWQYKPAWMAIIKKLGMTVVMFGIATLPFLLSFKPFVSGIGVNCPPRALWDRQIGPFLFENGEKCQKSPLWMMMLLWGFFVFGGLGLFFGPKTTEEKTKQEILAIISLFCLLLIIFPEFFYFKDIYPAHFRSNTMFKLGYQVFMMMSIVTGYVLYLAIKYLKQRWWYAVVSLPLVYLVLIYPTFAVKSYFGNLETYKGLYGLEWMKASRPDDWKLVQWLDTQLPSKVQPVVLEATGDSYTDYERISAFTGMPTVAGWIVHEWLWRGYDKISAREIEVREIYEGTNIDKTRQLISKYKIEFITIGDLEREKYENLNLDKLRQLGRVVFSQGDILLLQVS